ncbi:hypothetical protein BO79DRAFT_253953 [Aspergillus costaricaensis CBS 115574]|uniref:Uncharacterized protein n=1 Tax=Aspergillus costaricaensis CBS 115574 TaxID=1448317 RepID=A0ACD1IJC9_9EURO|nr:hypothetical protein BO79DRAFT_253953 [Aspergillus costaricaensis CBS 115574]RAK89854.1 hypothetical protein BO79DRAFT_253953 [Aspergillus costaricaensis CBS 115574]
MPHSNISLSDSDSEPEVPRPLNTLHIMIREMLYKVRENGSTISALEAWVETVDPEAYRKDPWPQDLIDAHAHYKALVAEINSKRMAYNNSVHYSLKEKLRYTLKVQLERLTQEEVSNYSRRDTSTLGININININIILLILVIHVFWVWRHNKNNEQARLNVQTYGSRQEDAKTFEAPFVNSEALSLRSLVHLSQTPEKAAKPCPARHGPISHSLGPCLQTQLWFYIRCLPVTVKELMHIQKVLWKYIWDPRPGGPIANVQAMRPFAEGGLGVIDFKTMQKAESGVSAERLWKGLYHRKIDYPKLTDLYWKLLLNKVTTGERELP